MKKDRIRWMLAVGLLGLLGFNSCSPRLRPRRSVKAVVDTVRVIVDPDTARFIKPLPNPGDMPPAKLMYGVPPARFEPMQLPDKELNKIELK